MVRSLTITLIACSIAIFAQAQELNHPRSLDRLLTDLKVAVKIGERHFGFTSSFELGFYNAVEGASIVDFTDCRTETVRKVPIVDIEPSEEDDCTRHGPGGIMPTKMIVWEFDSERKGFTATTADGGSVISSFIPCERIPSTLVVAANASYENKSQLFATVDSIGKAIEIGQGLGLELNADAVEPVDNTISAENCGMTQVFATIPFLTEETTSNIEATGVLTSATAISEFREMFDEKKF